MRPAGMLRRSVRTDVAEINSASQWYAKGLNCSVQVHVKQGILIVPYASRRVGYLVAYESNSIVTRIGFDLMAGCIRTVLATGEKVKNVGPQAFFE